ncbi:Serine/threonine-protein kinase KIC1 [Yarrowia sp. C11]|nr:Serine/threonine-protein kinase KIC1 [Yarrowia sp. C11]KAG5371213.1 Serine/threonine-protein kinase KIC1 [Yarrowia sp. E02]
MINSLYRLLQNTELSTSPPQHWDMQTSTPVTSIYQRQEVIGRGNFGVVYKGYHKKTKQLVAIKVLNLDTAEDDVKEVQHEIQLLSQLKLADAENITRYHGSYLHGSRLWIIMEYCAGGSVRTLMKAGRIDERHLSIITRELLIAIQYMHKAGIIHRDIKAANILITQQGRVQLCDFGVAAQLVSSKTKRSTIVGTPYWMAPEVITEGASYNVKADIWSLGITLFEIATGSPPLSDQEAMRAIFLIPRNKPARLEGSQYSAALKEIVALCLDELPDERPSAEELSKTKFVRSSKGIPTSTIKDLISRYMHWREHNKSRDSMAVYNRQSIGSEEDIVDHSDDFRWDFDTSTAPDEHARVEVHNGQVDFRPESTHAYRDIGEMGTQVLLQSTVSASEVLEQRYEQQQSQLQHGDMNTATNTMTLPQEEEEPHPLLELFVDENEPPAPSPARPELSSSMSLPTVPTQKAQMASVAPTLNDLREEGEPPGVPPMAMSRRKTLGRGSKMGASPEKDHPQPPPLQHSHSFAQTQGQGQTLNQTTHSGQPIHPGLGNLPQVQQQPPPQMQPPMPQIHQTIPPVPHTQPPQMPPLPQQQPPQQSLAPPPPMAQAPPPPAPMHHSPASLAAVAAAKSAINAANPASGATLAAPHQVYPKRTPSPHRPSSPPSQFHRPSISSVSSISSAAVSPSAAASPVMSHKSSVSSEDGGYASPPMIPRSENPQLATRSASVPDVALSRSDINGKSPGYNTEKPAKLRNVNLQIKMPPTQAPPMPDGYATPSRKEEFAPTLNIPSQPSSRRPSRAAQTQSPMQPTLQFPPIPKIDLSVLLDPAPHADVTRELEKLLTSFEDALKVMEVGFSSI